uniref:Uncharacterized protein n=1 Tax=Cacopsylla melanoneura TaxID=428564 RepID=A0A8D9BYW2_9HEMI
MKAIITDIGTYIRFRIPPIRVWHQQYQHFLGKQSVDWKTKLVSQNYVGFFVRSKATESYVVGSYLPASFRCLIKIFRIFGIHLVNYFIYLLFKSFLQGYSAKPDP